MSSLKALVYDVCAQVAMEFSGWRFVSGKFKSSLLGHTELIVDLGLHFDRGFSSLQPRVEVRNKRCELLAKSLLDIKDRHAIPVSAIGFRNFREQLQFTPESKRGTCIICLDKESFVAEIRKKDSGDSEMRLRKENAAIGVEELYPIIGAMIKDSILFLESHYDFSSEENLLRGLPVRYEAREKVPYAELEKSAGLVFCIVRLMLGDFAFVESYASDSYKTIYPKRTVELKKIIEKLPALKARYAEIGSVF